MDIKVPGVVYVGIIRSPKFGGVLTSFDASSAKNVSGFVDARAMPDNTVLPFMQKIHGQLRNPETQFL